VSEEIVIGVTFLVRTLDRLIAIKAFEICGHIVMKLGGAPHGHDKRRCLAEILALRELSTSNYALVTQAEEPSRGPVDSDHGLHADVDEINLLSFQCSTRVLFREQSQAPLVADRVGGA